MVKNSVLSNVWKMYFFRFLVSFKLVAPVIIPFYLSLNLTATNIFILTAVFTASTIIFEIPSGYLSDVIGRKKILALSGFVYVLGAIIYAFSSNYYLFILAQILFGIGVSLFSGTDTSVIYDSLKQSKKISDFKKVVGRSRFFIRIAASLSSFIGGALALITLRMPFYVAITIPLFLIPLSLSITEPKRKKRKAKRSAMLDIGKISKFVLSHKKLMSLNMFNATVAGIMLMITTSYFLYFNILGFTAADNGIIFGFIMILGAIGALTSHKIENKLGKKASFFLLIIPGFILLLLGMFESVFIIPFIFVNGFIIGFSRPLFSGHTNDLISSEIRATALSIGNIVKILPIVILSPLLGILIDATSLSVSFITIGIFYLLLASLSLFLLRKHKLI